MKKQFYLFLLMLMPLMASADDPVEINGIWYNLITKTRIAEVTKVTTKYTGKYTLLYPHYPNYLLFHLAKEVKGILGDSNWV